MLDRKEVEKKRPGKTGETILFSPTEKSEDLQAVGGTN